jgi:hypothetical protein
MAANAPNDRVTESGFSSVNSSPRFDLNRQSFLSRYRRKYILTSYNYIFRRVGYYHEEKAKQIAKRDQRDLDLRFTDPLNGDPNRTG